MLDHELKFNTTEMGYDFACGSTIDEMTEHKSSNGIEQLRVDKQLTYVVVSI